MGFKSEFQKYYFSLEKGRFIILVGQVFEAASILSFDWSLVFLLLKTFHQLHCKPCK